MAAKPKKEKSGYPMPQEKLGTGSAAKRVSAGRTKGKGFALTGAGAIQSGGLES
jgi:hypothetical protein